MFFVSLPTGQSKFTFQTHYKEGMGRWVMRRVGRNPLPITHHPDPVTLLICTFYATSRRHS
jgi:hypothetical protein